MCLNVNLYSGIFKSSGSKKMPREQTMIRPDVAAVGLTTQIRKRITSAPVHAQNIVHSLQFRALIALGGSGGCSFCIIWVLQGCDVLLCRARG
jgi:hypothetical protein